MGKRSNFERFDRDYYTTPVEGVIPLLPHIMGKIQRFAEPCAGNGALIDHIEKNSNIETPVCTYACDIEPQRKDIIKKNALQLTKNDAVGAEVFITNPPWDRSILHPLIFHLTAFSHTEPFSNFFCFILFFRKILSYHQIVYQINTNNNYLYLCLYYL